MGRDVYIETSVPSAWVSGRTDPGSVHRREITRTWWASQRAHYDIWISDAVVLELSEGDWPGKQDAIRLVDPLSRLLIDEEVIAVARRYISERLVPGDLAGDATHLAVTRTSAVLTVK